MADTMLAVPGIARAGMAHGFTGDITHERNPSRIG
jgi:hypothetical protein